jgi:hypothetical protein
VTAAQRRGLIRAVPARMRVSFFISVAMVPALDLSGGTALMPLAAYLAGVQADVAVVYTSATPGRFGSDPHRFHDLVAIHDPDGLLTGPADSPAVPDPGVGSGAVAAREDSHA